MNSERRRVPRRRINTPVGVLSHGTYNVHRALQLGEGGMLIASPDKLELGHKLVLTFRIPYGPSVVATAIIRYNKGDGSLDYGVEFVHLDFTIRRAIRNFVASQTAENDWNL